MHLNSLKIIALKRYFVFLLCGLLMFPAVVFAKDEPDSLSHPQSFLYRNSTGNFLYKNYTAGTNFIDQSKNTTTETSKRNWFRAIRYSGYARFYPLYRKMNSYYNEPALAAQGLTVPGNLTADDGYPQPLMLFRLEANPTAKSWFQMEWQFDNLLKRTNTFTDTSGRIANLYIILQLQGGVETKFGKFKVIAGGGVNWYRLSPSTLWQYQFRDDLFDRYPWEPEGHDFARYNSAYASGDIPRDQRFGKQATQGFILEGTNLPAGFEAVAIYGKAATSGGFQSYLTQNNMNMVAGRVAKTFGNHKIGYNYFNQFGYTSNTINYTKVVKE